jgi:hypothetical protein
MNNLKDKIREQFNGISIIQDPFNVYSFSFIIYFKPYIYVFFEVEKCPEVDCYLLTHSGQFRADEGVSTVGVVRYTLNTERELLDKIKEVLEEYNKLSDLLNNLYRD